MCVNTNKFCSVNRIAAVGAGGGAIGGALIAAPLYGMAISRATGWKAKLAAGLTEVALGAAEGAASGALVGATGGAVLKHMNKKGRE